MKKEGISLIVLILIIVVMTILAGSVIVSVGGNNMFNRAKEAVKRNDIQTMIDNYKSIYDDLIYKYEGDLSLLKDSDFENKGIINEKYSKVFTVDKNGLIYSGNDLEIIKLASELGFRIAEEEETQTLPGE